MKILVLDTSQAVCSVGLYDACRDKKFFQIEHVAKKLQAALILPTIKAIMNDAQVELNMLDAIAYNAGPGSFTGTRIACSVTQAISFAFSLPVIQLSSLLIMAQAAYLITRKKNILVILDARMNQLYHATFSINDDGLAVMSNHKIMLSSFDKLAIPHRVGKEWCLVSDMKKDDLKKIIDTIGSEVTVFDCNNLQTAKAMILLSVEQFKKASWTTEIKDIQPAYPRETYRKAAV